MCGESWAPVVGFSVISIAASWKSFGLEVMESRPDVGPPELCCEVTWWSLSVVSGMSIVGAIKTVATAMSTASTTPILNTRDIIYAHTSKHLCKC